MSLFGRRLSRPLAPAPTADAARKWALGVKLDSMGFTLVNFEDPVDGSTIVGLDWEQVEALVAKYEGFLPHD